MVRRKFNCEFSISFNFATAFNSVTLRTSDESMERTTSSTSSAAHELMKWWQWKHPTIAQEWEAKWNRLCKFDFILANFSLLSFSTRCSANDIWNSEFEFLLDLKYLSFHLKIIVSTSHLLLCSLLLIFFGAAAALQWGEEFKLKEFVRQLKFFSKFIPVVTLLMWLIEKWVGARRRESTHVRAILWTRCLCEYVRCRWRTKEFDLDSAKLAVFNCHD